MSVEKVLAEEIDRHMLVLGGGVTNCICGEWGFDARTKEQRKARTSFHEHVAAAILATEPGSRLTLADPDDSHLTLEAALHQRDIRANGLHDQMCTGHEYEARVLAHYLPDYDEQERLAAIGAAVLQAWPEYLDHLVVGSSQSIADKYLRQAIAKALGDPS